jgi:hypothetical protein
MIALSIPGHDSSYDDDHCALVYDNAFWLPDLPSDQLVFRGAGPSSAGGRRKHYPFSTILFGGLSGEHLPHLTKVTFWIEKRISPVGREHERGFGISVEYDIQVDGRKIHTFGQVPGCHQAWPGGRGSEEEFTRQFKRIPVRVDGPGGERITQLDIQIIRIAPLYRLQVSCQISSSPSPRLFLVYSQVPDSHKLWPIHQNQDTRRSRTRRTLE